MALLNFVSWYKGITLLKYFEATRIFIHLLEQVMVDVVTFLKIFLYAMLMFSSTFFILFMDQVKKEESDSKGACLEDIRDGIVKKEEQAFF